MHDNTLEMLIDEAIKLILNKGIPLIGRILIYDALDTYFRVFELKRNEMCPLCGKNQSITILDHANYQEEISDCSI